MACWIYLSLLAAVAAIAVIRCDDVVQDNNDFSFKLFNKVATDNKDFVCSPLSVAVVLSMLMDGAGATSDTYSQIRAALGYGNAIDADTSYQTLIPTLQSSTNYQLSLANSIWINSMYTLSSDYVTNMMTYFSAEVQSFTGASDGTTKINTWVADHTNQKIPKLFDSVPDDTVTVVVNAIYFLGNWVKQFDPKKTFTGLFDGTLSVSYMYQESRFPYKDSSAINSKILQLPYKGDDVVLVLVLPNDPQTLENTLSNADFQTEAFGDLNLSQVKVTIPKFKTETTIDLNKPLMDMGIVDAFSSKADFSRMSTTAGLSISKVVQKAYIQVDETGTEAAAATGGIVTTTAVFPTVEFKADRPYIYCLYHKTAKSVLFVGKYVGVSS